MKYFTVIICIMVLLFGLACQSNGKTSRSAPQSPCPIEKFNKTDSTVNFTGTVAFWDKPSAMVSYGGLYLTDKNNDTIIFRVEPGEVDGFFEDSLKPGKCVTVNYATEIVEEDGIELNRFYHAKKLAYP
jgi:hypothetical protein